MSIREGGDVEAHTDGSDVVYLGAPQKNKDSGGGQGGGGTRIPDLGWGGGGCLVPKNKSLTPGKISQKGNQELKLSARCKPILSDSSDSGKCTSSLQS